MTTVTDALPTTTLVWVRHGEAANNRDRRIGGWTDMPLTPHGEAQAMAAAKALAAAPSIDAVWSSDLARAHSTAAAIAAQLGLPIVLETGLRERSLGVLDGLPFATCEADHGEIFGRLMRGDPDAVPPGGETLRQVYDRIANVLERAIAAHVGGQVVLVSHGIALFHAFCHVVGLGPPDGKQQIFSLVGNASISRVAHRKSASGRDRYQLLAWNDTSHLDGVVPNSNEL